MLQVIRYFLVTSYYFMGSIITIFYSFVYIFLIWERGQVHKLPSPFWIRRSLLQKRPPPQKPQ